VLELPLQPNRGLSLMLRAVVTVLVQPLRQEVVLQVQARAMALGLQSVPVQLPPVGLLGLALVLVVMLAPQGQLVSLGPLAVPLRHGAGIPPQGSMPNWAMELPRLVLLLLPAQVLLSQLVVVSQLLPLELAFSRLQSQW